MGNFPRPNATPNLHRTRHVGADCRDDVTIDRVTRSGCVEINEMNPLGT
jgi:hypothetical protein